MFTMVYLAKKMGDKIIPGVPNAYTYFASRSQLSDKRKEVIEERRAQLKIESHDLPIVKIIIDELLAYKPTPFTLNDRYLQLEQLLDAIDDSKSTQQTNKLIDVAEKIMQEMLSSPTRFNVFLERLQTANLRIKALESSTIRARL